MAFSIIQTTATGSSNTFPINFTLGFNNRNEVTCQVNNEVDGLGAPVYRTLTWINDGMVTVEPAASIIPAGQPVVFKRTITKTALIHDYSNGEAIEESNLDESNKQNIMAIHELFDGRFTAAFQQDLDLGSHKLINIANGTNPQDAVSKAQLDVVATVASSTAADAAAAHADRLLADADVVLTHADVVTTNATAATVGAYDLTGTQTLDDTIMWSTGVSKFVRRSLAYLKTQLSLGTAASANIGTSGATVPVLNAANTFSGLNTFATAPVVPTQAAGTNNTTPATTAFVTANAILKAGGTMTGKLNTVASASGTAGFNLPAGVAPSSPTNGDLWSTIAGFFGRSNGVTSQLMGTPVYSGNSSAGMIKFTGGFKIQWQLSNGTTAYTFGEAYVNNPPIVWGAWQINPGNAYSNNMAIVAPTTLSGFTAATAQVTGNMMYISLGI